MGKAKKRALGRLKVAGRPFGDGKKKKGVWKHLGHMNIAWEHLVVSGNEWELAEVE
jgi:hypothetical protein